MLVSGGQILAIDHVVHDNTLTGDGSTKALGVNTNAIATTALVSGTSATLHEEISAVSAKMHETEVSGDNTTIDVIRKVKEDGKTVVYEVSARPQAALVLHGINGISAEPVQDGWNISYTGQQGNIYSAHADGRDHTRIYQEGGQWYLSAYVPDTSKFITSAKDTLAGKALVLKDNEWVPADEAHSDIVTINTFNEYNEYVNSSFVSNSSFSSYSSTINNQITNLTDIAESYSSYSSLYYDASTAVSSYSSYWNEVSAFSANSGEFMLTAKLGYDDPADPHYITGYNNIPFSDKDTTYVGINGIEVDKTDPEHPTIGISANFLSANALDDLSGKWEDVYNTVNDASGHWDAHSALSASKLDASESAKFMKLEDLKGTENGEISGYGESAFYYPPFPEIPEYSGKDGIKVENYEISISADYLSANALDELSGKWEDAADTVSSYSAAWNESSAFSAASGKFVTSAIEDFENQNLAYVLKNTDGTIAWSGVDLSELGKMYGMSSLTPNRILATISAVDENTSAYVISAAPAEAFNAPDMNGEGCYADYDSANTAYKVKVDIKGNNGISAAYNLVDQQWNIGISANDYSYLAGLYDKQAALTEGSIIKYDSNNTQHIEIDEDGYFTLPDTGNKFTFCINESIENNTTTSHDYKLNKIALVKVNTQTDAEEVIVSTHNYYPSEVGASDANITFTLSHLPNYKYAVKYLGSDIPATANLVSKISIIEEITSLATTEGGGRTYGGVEPVWVDNDANLVGLAYDRSQFKIVTGVDDAHPELSALQIDIQTTGGNIDQEAFEKMANLIYGRLTETIPIGLVNSYESLGNGGAFSYLFRPTMEFDVNSGTKARIMTHNGTVGTSKAQIAISELDESNANVTIMWWSEIKTLTAQAGTLTLSANPGCTETRTLYPDRLYYASIINRDQETQYVGFKNEFLTDAGAYDIAYWDEHSTNNDHFAGSLPGSLNGIPAGSLGQVGQAKLKPYIAFRNED